MVRTCGIGLPYHPTYAIYLQAKSLELRLSLSSLVTSPQRLTFSNCGRDHAKQRFVQPSFFDNRKRMDWSIYNSADGRGFDPLTNNGNGRNRLIKAVQNLLSRLIAKIQHLRKDFPRKFLFFLVGFYCATAFATVIGQTGDWDILSAALAVAVVEGIGALMYKASVPLLDKIRNLIVMFNYWKAGLALGLFLDSFKQMLELLVKGGSGYILDITQTRFHFSVVITLLRNSKKKSTSQLLAFETVSWVPLTSVYVYGILCCAEANEDE